jgi:2-polyprenyl-6-methoxyphenol hydroxylase-like FAD-dependent oxidoreductase
VSIQKSISVGIVGAGLTGLFAAIQLLRYGIQPIVIDQKKGPDRRLEPLWLHRRSLELLDQVGLLASLLPQMRPIHQLDLVINAEEPIPFHPFVQEGASPELPIWMEVSHKDLEQHCIQYLTQHACVIHWDTTLLSWKNEPHHVVWNLLREGKETSWQCDWMIAADGAQGKMRQALQASSTRGAQSSAYFSRWKLKHSLPTPFLWTNGLFEILFVPLSHDQLQASYYGNKVDKEGHRRHIQEAFSMLMKKEGSADFQLEQFEKFDLDPQFQNGGRSFLVGGAAHGWPSSSPTAQQAGWQDASNLAWKLAMVIQQRLQPKILHRYATERQHQHPFGYLLSHEPSSFNSFSNWVGSWTKGLRTRNLLQQIKLSTKKDVLAKRWAGWATHYRYSPLSIQYSLKEALSAGDRLPAIPLFDEKQKKMTSLAERCRTSGFELLLLGTLSPSTLQAIGQYVQYRYPQDMRVYYVPYSSSNQSLFSIFEIANEANKLVLVRPDGYIAYINDTVNIGLVDTYMKEVLGLIDHARFHSRN